MTHKSILPNEIQGVQKITGYRGLGKTSYAAQVENPKLTAMFDFEKKGQGFHAQLGFGFYSPVTELASGGNVVSVWETFLREVNKLPPHITHVILDNTAPLELGMRAEVGRNAEIYAKQFGMDAGNIRANKYGGQGGVVNYLISEKICNPLWARGVQLITITSHIKPRWANGVQVVNSYNIKGADRWDELSVLTLILIPGESHPVPSALVIKEQLGKIEFDEETGAFSQVRRLPLRLPKATPREVINYLHHPADLKNPKPGEVPTTDEAKPFSEKLDKEQLTLVLAEIQRNEREQMAIKTAALPPVEERIAELLVADDNPVSIRQSLLLDGYVITPPKVNQIIKSIKGE